MRIIQMINYFPVQTKRIQARASPLKVHEQKKSISAQVVIIIRSIVLMY